MSAAGEAAGEDTYVAAGLVLELELKLTAPCWRGSCWSPAVPWPSWAVPNSGKRKSKACGSSDAPLTAELASQPDLESAGGSEGGAVGGGAVLQELGVCRSKTS